MRSKRRVIGIIIAVVFVFLMSTFLLSNNLIEAQETKDKQFTSIQVQKGDTLWKIAKKYMGNEYSSVDDYIEEVCQTNHIYDGKITEDMYLVVYNIQGSHNDDDSWDVTGKNYALIINKQLAVIRLMYDCQL